MFGSRNMFDRKVKQLDPSKPASNKSARKISGSPVKLSYQSIGIYFQGKIYAVEPILELFKCFENCSVLSLSSIIDFF